MANKSKTGLVRASAMAIAIVLILQVCIFPVRLALAATAAVSSIQSGLNSAANQSGLDAGGLTDPVKIIGSLIGSLLSLIGVLLFLYILYGGFTWMTAAGDPGKTKSAMQIIRNAVIGIVIIVSAYAISNFVITQIGAAAGGGTGSNLPSVSTK